jgi:anti-repressor protein
MNELIAIKREGEKETVNARELHEFLESKQDFSDWVKNRIEKFGFVENEDFTIILGKSSGGRPSKEYFLSIDMAKELSMVENNEKGRQARLYFIEVEKRAREVLTGPVLLAKAVIEAQAMLEQKDKVILEMKPKADFYDAVAGSKSAIHIGQAAKILDFPRMGQNNLFVFLREQAILQSDNIPYQRYVDAGYFRVILQKYQTPNGETHTTATTLVYPRGLSFIRRQLEQAGYLPRIEPEQPGQQPLFVEGM